MLVRLLAHLLRLRSWAARQSVAQVAVLQPSASPSNTRHGGLVVDEDARLADEIRVRPSHLEVKTGKAPCLAVTEDTLELEPSRARSGVPTSSSPPPASPSRAPRRDALDCR